MAKSQGKKVAARGSGARKVVGAKKASGAAKKKAVKSAKPAPKKRVTAKPKPKKQPAKAVKKAKAPGKGKAAAKAVKAKIGKVRAKAVKAKVAKVVKAKVVKAKVVKAKVVKAKVVKAKVVKAKVVKAKVVKTKAVKAVKATLDKASAARETGKQVATKPVAPKAGKAAPKKAGSAPAAVTAPSPAGPKRAVEPDKKRTRRARPRVMSSGVPVAAWLSTEKPRPASFIPAPPRAEAPSAIAAPPASSDRLLRPDDVVHPAVRTVPVRIDVEQGAGRFFVIASPVETSVRVGEGIEWDFRYIGGADVAVDEMVIEFDKPSPFSHSVFRTRKPGGARPHRQLSGGALAAAVGRRVQYNVRAITQFKTDVASTRIWVNIE